LYNFFNNPGSLVFAEKDCAEGAAGAGAGISSTGMFFIAGSWGAFCGATDASEDAISGLIANL
jgi:hypothetical protein